MSIFNEDLEENGIQWQVKIKKKVTSTKLYCINTFGAGELASALAVYAFG